MPGVAGNMLPVNVVPVSPTKTAFVVGLKSQFENSS